MASNQTKIEHWLGMNVTLFKESDIEKRNRELTGATDVHNIYTMITVHTGCCELALTTSLVERLDLEYFDTVSVSSSTDNNDRIKRYGPVLPSAGQREGAIAPLKFFCRPADDCFSLNLISIGTTTRYDVKVIGCDANIKRFEDEYNVKIHLTNEGSSKMIFILSAKRFDVDLDFVALAVTELVPSLKPIEYQYPRGKRIWKRRHLCDSISEDISLIRSSHTTDNPQSFLLGLLIVEWNGT
ncbi:unnamed protein product [Adineta ricciae]|uniref:Uncharacterized protein n=1 Tax=Adineta ricciae TaxID=249248 RepID=A0A815VQQ6_ADIRI|nr:unnamed protein product [Adineta ricciae]